jgi:hypothetical protein
MLDHPLGRHVGSITARHLVGAKTGFSTITQSDCRSRIEQPVHWGAGCGGVVGRWEQIFWASFLFVIAAFYLSFAAYFGASLPAWQTELIGVGVACQVIGMEIEHG